MPYSSRIQENNASFNSENEENHLALDTQDDSAHLIATPDGKILFSNKAFADLCLCSSINTAQYITDLFYFDKTQDFSQDGEYSVTLKNDQRNIMLQFNWVEAQNGERYLVASAEEITAREKLLQFVAQKIEEQAQQETDSNIFVNLSPDAHCIIEKDGKITNKNQNFVQLFGTQDNLFNVILPQNKQEFQNIISNLQKPSLIESYCFDSTGNHLWIEWHCKEQQGQIFCIGRNTTSLKSHQEALQAEQKKLAEAEAIGHIGQWLWQVGNDDIEFSNQLFQIFGVTSENFKPTLDNVNDMIHSHDSDRMIQVFQRAIIEQKDYDMDFRVIRPDGEIRYIRCEGRCKTDQDDDVVALYGIMQDVTDTTERELDLKKAKESVERAYAAKSQFLANMSHELRTPLNAIIGFSEMIERQLLGPIGTEKYLEYVSGIRESGEHLLDLISDILDMSKIEAGKYELHLERFNVSKTIRTAAHMMEGRALDSDIKIKINLEDEELNIVADRRAILQTVLNILSNAVKFSKQSSTVEILLNKQQETFSITVKDSGIGIPANKLTNITMPFEQAESDYKKKYEGSGLGLSITKELVEIHGGALHIESTIDVGTEVTMKLPYERQK